MEEYRAGRGLDEIYYAEGKPEGVPIECADVFIRLVDAAEAYGFDLEEAVRIKMAFNRTRPFRHGNKVA